MQLLRETWTVTNERIFQKQHCRKARNVAVERFSIPFNLPNSLREGKWEICGVPRFLLFQSLDSVSSITFADAKSFPTGASSPRNVPLRLTPPWASRGSTFDAGVWCHLVMQATLSQRQSRRTWSISHGKSHAVVTQPVGLKIYLLLIWPIVVWKHSADPWKQ